MRKAPQILMYQNKNPEGAGKDGSQAVRTRFVVLRMDDTRNCFSVLLSNEMRVQRGRGNVRA